jgi:hypothetical protein
MPMLWYIAAVVQTSGHCTATMLPTSMSRKCSDSPVLASVRMTAAEATA